MRGKGSVERASKLIEKAYAAALDDSLWLDWTNDLTAALDCVCGNFFVLAGGDQTIERMFPIWRGVEMLDEYQAHWWQFDPQVTHVSSIRRPTIYRSQDHVDESIASVSDFCRWQRAKGHYDHHISLIATLGSEDRKGGVALHRSLEAGPATPDGERELRLILPDIARAFRLGFQHQALLATSFWEGVGARHAGEAVLLIDERGAVMRATDAALAITANGDGLTLTGSLLRSATPSDDTALTELIGRAIAPVAATSGATRIHRPSGKRPYIAVSYPLVRKRRVLAPLEAAALVRVVDPSSSTVGSAIPLQEAFGLTRREVELALLLIADHSVESAATVMAIAPPTARIHLARLLAKTGTSRQAELIRLIAKVL